MPTALPLAFREVSAPLEHSARPAIATCRDLAVILSFAGIALALTIGFAVLFPQAANAVALAFMAS